MNSDCSIAQIERDVRSVDSWSQEELMALSVRKQGDNQEYDSLLLIRTQHFSGRWAIVIVGVRDNQPEEIACKCCDAIEWKLPPTKTPVEQFRMDRAIRSGARHVWRKGARFKVGAALSITTVEMIISESHDGGKAGADKLRAEGMNKLARKIEAVSEYLPGWEKEELFELFDEAAMNVMGVRLLSERG